MTLDLPRPAWWSQDVPFDKTGKTQLGWAKEAAAAYRAAHPERYGVTPSVTDSVTSAGKSVTSVTKSVTSPKSVTQSVTGVTDTVTGVTSVTTIISKQEKTAERTRRWRAAKQEKD